MEPDSSIYVAGHAGMLGSAICRSLRRHGYRNLLTASRQELDLTRQESVENWFDSRQVDYVFLAAALVGGIAENMTRPADFGYVNAMIQLNVMEAARRSSVKKLLFLGSSCVYPRDCAQPMQISSLLTGPFEPTNEMYGFAKLFGAKMCGAYNTQYETNFISGLPCNLYGEGDHFDPERGHVIGSLIHRIHQAKQTQTPSVQIWGDGSPRREFLYVDDCAEACILMMQSYEGDLPLNIGSGTDVSIRELAELIAEVIGYDGKLVFDTTRPNGIPQKLVDNQDLLALGWQAKYKLREGIEQSYQYYLNQETGHALPTS